jgi:hypothetical protein
MKHLYFAAPLVIAMLVPSMSLAQANNKALAQATYDKARELIKNGKIEEACAAFADSQKLDPALGTLVALGACHEKQGKVASAWAEYLEASGMGDSPAAKFARDRVDALAVQVPKVRTLLPFDYPKDATFTLDGNDIALSVLKLDLPIDPGHHTLTIASGTKKGTVSFDATAGAGVVEVKLDFEQAAPQTAPSAGASAATTTPPPSSPSSGGGGDRTIGLVVGGVGVGVLAVAGVFGVLTLVNDGKRQSEVNLYNSTGTPADLTSATNYRNTALTFQTLGFITGGVGIVCIATGAYFFLTAKSEAPKTSLLPYVGPGGGGFVFSHSF